MYELSLSFRVISKDFSESIGRNNTYLIDYNGETITLTLEKIEKYLFKKNLVEKTFPPKNKAEEILLLGTEKTS